MDGEETKIKIIKMIGKTAIKIVIIPGEIIQTIIIIMKIGEII